MPWGARSLTVCVWAGVREVHWGRCGDGHMRHNTKGLQLGGVLILVKQQ